MQRRLLLNFSYLTIGLFTFALSSAPTQEVFLSDLQEESVQGLAGKYWPELCKNCVFHANEKKPITIEEKQFEKGLGVHPTHNGVAIVTYSLGGTYTTLEFYAGISGYLNNGWSEWGRVDENGTYYGLERKSAESETHIKIGAGSGISVYGDGKQIGDTVFVTARTEAKLSRFTVSGVNELAIHFSAWGMEPCDAPYHSGGSYPGCPRLIGAAYSDHVVIGDAKLITGGVANGPERSVLRQSDFTLAVARNGRRIRIMLPHHIEADGFMTLYRLSGELLRRRSFHSTTRSVEWNIPELAAHCCIVKVDAGDFQAITPVHLTR